jgi:hypothetical protein
MTNENPTGREPKKTVSIEVRVSEEDKRAFWDACRAANRPASAVLRNLMELFVAFRNLRDRMFATMKRFIRHPFTTVFAAFAMATALSTSLLLSPSAAADFRMAYQVIVDDGVGQIVSQGHTDVGSNIDEPNINADTLGDDVRFAFEVQSCDARAEMSCSTGDMLILLSIWESNSGQVETAVDRGVVVSPSDETRFEMVLGDGRELSVLFVPLA